nr:putative zinc finger, CCHC-type, retrotransposon Gag domain protein [Tanacetum cinerariifolium]
MPTIDQAGMLDPPGEDVRNALLLCITAGICFTVVNKLKQTAANYHHTPKNKPKQSSRSSAIIISVVEEAGHAKMRKLLTDVTLPEQECNNPSFRSIGFDNPVRGLNPKPFIMLENYEISSLAFFLGYGGSGDGDGPLPMGFRGCCRLKRWEKMVYRFGREGEKGMYSVLNRGCRIIMVNLIHPHHVDDVLVVELNQHDDVPVVPEPVLVDENKDLKEDEFDEEEDPQEEEDDMEVDIEEDGNKPELTDPYEEVDPLNPSPPASESKPEDAIEVENLIEYEDEIVPASVHEIGTLTLFLVGWLHFPDDCVVVKRRMHWSRRKEKQRTSIMLGNTEDKVECKKLKKGLEEARFSNTFLRMQNEQVERDLYWTRVRAHEIMPLKSTPLTQAAIRRMIKENVDVAITADRARQADAGNDARGSRPVRGQDTTPAVHECTFAGFMKCNPTAFHGTEGAVELLRWFEKTKSVFGISECEESKMVKFAAVTLQGPALTWWNAKVATMGLETVNQMP